MQAMLGSDGKSATRLRTLVTVLFVLASAGLVLTGLLGLEAPNDALLITSIGLLFAAVLAVFAHLGTTDRLTNRQKRVWLRKLTGRTAVSAWADYLNCDDLQAAAIRFAEEELNSDREHSRRH
jgi:hypothetical protein